MNMRGWHEFGQTWLVWEDTAPTPETYRIFKASSQITDLSSAEQIGRVFEREWTGDRLKKLDSSLNWTIPDGSGGTYTLTSNEALFVYTPHKAMSEYFVVVKDGEAAIGSNNRIGPISQTIGPVQCHLQTSGTQDGFAYRVYAHWIDGRNDCNSGRADYPVMGNEHFNGTGHLFRIWEPQGRVPQELTPAVIAMHGGGGWYGGINPSSDKKYDLSRADAFVICPGDRVLVKKRGTIDYQRTYWLGYWEGYDRFRLPNEQSVPGDGLVVNYTMRRLDWELGWLLDNESIDPKRVSLLGGSMGGRGANYQARAHPERYAAWLSLSPGLEPLAEEYPFVGSVSQNLPTNLPGAPSVLEVMDLYTVLSKTERDIPFGKIVIGRADRGRASRWTARKVQTFKRLNDTSFGCHLYWDERGHVYTPGSHWADSFRLKAKALTRYRSDQSFPAFFNDDQDSKTPGRQPNMGNGDASDGDVWGTWGGYCSWEPDTVVDSRTKWETTIFLVESSSYVNDVPSFASSRTDISIRRPQQFTPAAGTTITWTFTRLSNSHVVQSGQEIVGQDGVVKIPSLTIYKDRCRLCIKSTFTNTRSLPDNN
jgi:hypothetical protein